MFSLALLSLGVVVAVSASATSSPVIPLSSSNAAASAAPSGVVAALIANATTSPVIPLSSPEPAASDFALDPITLGLQGRSIQKPTTLATVTSAAREKHDIDPFLSSLKHFLATHTPRLIPPEGKKADRKRGEHHIFDSNDPVHKGHKNHNDEKADQVEEDFEDWHDFQHFQTLKFEYEASAGPASTGTTTTRTHPTRTRATTVTPPFPNTILARAVPEAEVSLTNPVGR